ncbi:DUF1015 family protein [Pseudonocardia lacus]|uniref:DUF1015 family protein n=1 Tax=Pseudonocardia lacus TaxID=2835865 RepID=UPI001BDD8DA4|nr:DUF1015 family protein [Pseudonocardia lacus]
MRPFDAWLVRAEAAADEVAPMSEVAVDARVAPRPVSPDAYEPMSPALYVYRQRTPESEHVGIVCDIAPEAFLDGRVRGHESVRADRVDALARYLVTSPQRVELVSTLHRAGPVLRATLASTSALPPVRDLDGPGATRHTVWTIPDGPLTDRLRREVDAATHYIADGHHRVAASLQVWQRTGRDSGRGVLCVAYPLDGLQLSSFDRRLTGPVDAALVRHLLEASFEVRPAAGVPEASASAIAVYLGRRWYTATFSGERAPGAAGLDVSLLHARALDHLPAGTAVEATRAPTDALVAACDADGGALFVLPAPDLETLTAIADAGEVVPAKSTYFSPKPASGVFLRGTR